MAQSWLGCKPTPFPPPPLPSRPQLTAKVEALAASIDPAAPWEHPDAILDTTTLEAWVRANVKTEFGASGCPRCVPPPLPLPLHLTVVLLLQRLGALGGARWAPSCACSHGRVAQP